MSRVHLQTFPFRKWLTGVWRSVHACVMARSCYLHTWAHLLHIVSTTTCHTKERLQPRMRCVCVCVMQIVAMLDATDSMTSQTIEARHSYLASDIVLNSMPLLLRRCNNGQLVVDYTCFVQRSEDDTEHATNGSNFSPDPGANSMCMDSPEAALTFAEGVPSEQLPHLNDTSHLMEPLPCGSNFDERVSSGMFAKSCPTSHMGLLNTCPLGQDIEEPSGSFPGNREGLIDTFAQWRVDGAQGLMELDALPVPRVDAHEDGSERRRSMSGAGSQRMMKHVHPIICRILNSRRSCMW
jgi:hypothetical protein